MSLICVCGLYGGTSDTGKKILQALWLITAINNLPRSSIHLATEAIIRDLCEKAVQNT